MDNLTQLTTAHSRTMNLLAKAEEFESDYFLSHDTYDPRSYDELCSVIDDLIATASYLTGRIYETKKLLDDHDCHLSAEDGCMCVFLRGEEEEEEEEIDIDELRLESIRADVEAEQAYDLDEGVVITTTKTLNMPIYYEDDEVIIH